MEQLGHNLDINFELRHCFGNKLWTKTWFWTFILQSGHSFGHLF